MSRQPVFAFLGALAVSAAFSPAAVVLVRYDFTSNLNATTDANVTATAISAVNDGNQLLAQSTGPGIAGSGSTYTNGDPINDSDNFDPGDTGGPNGRAFARRFMTGTGDTFQHYIGTSLTVAPGFKLDLESVFFDVGFRSAGPDALKVEYSTASNFSNPILLGSGAGFIAPADAAATDLGYTSGGGLGVKRPTTTTNFSWNRFTNDANLAGDEALTGTVYFRAYLKGTTGAAGNAESNVFIDNFTINGTVTAVPEPAALSLLSLTAMTLLRRRRTPIGV